MRGAERSLLLPFFFLLSSCSDAQRKIHECRTHTAAAASQKKLFSFPFSPITKKRKKRKPLPWEMCSFLFFFSFPFLWDMEGKGKGSASGFAGFLLFLPSLFYDCLFLFFFRRLDGSRSMSDSSSGVSALLVCQDKGFRTEKTVSFQHVRNRTWKNNGK